MVAKQCNKTLLSVCFPCQRSKWFDTSQKQGTRRLGIAGRSCLTWPMSPSHYRLTTPLKYACWGKAFADAIRSRNNPFDLVRNVFLCLVIGRSNCCGRTIAPNHLRYQCDLFSAFKGNRGSSWWMVDLVTAQDGDFRALRWRALELCDKLWVCPRWSLFLSIVC